MVSQIRSLLRDGRVIKCSTMSLQCPSCDEKCARRKKLEDHITGVHGGPERILLNFNNWEGKSNFCDLIKGGCIYERSKYYQQLVK